MSHLPTIIEIYLFFSFHLKETDPATSVISQAILHATVLRNRAVTVEALEAAGEEVSQFFFKLKGFEIRMKRYNDEGGNQSIDKAN